MAYLVLYSLSYYVNKTGHWLLRKGDNTLLTDFKALVYGWGSTASRIESHRKGTVYLLTPSPCTQFINLFLYLNNLRRYSQDIRNENVIKASLYEARTMFAECKHFCFGIFKSPDI